MRVRGAALPRFEFVACHRMPHRSFFWRGTQLPVCARCTGMLLGYLAILPALFMAIPLPWALWGMLMNVPVYVDGMSQAMGWRESNNPLRFATGLAGGIGQVAVVSALGQWVGNTMYHYLFQGGI